MSRDASGNYTLVTGNPVVSGTEISSGWANPTLADIAAEMTDSLSRSGKGGMLAPFRFTSGDKSAPGITWTNEPATGLYYAGTQDMRVSVNGNDIFRWVAGGPQTWNAGDGVFYDVATSKDLDAISANVDSKQDKVEDVAILELNENGTGNRNTIIDFHSDDDAGHSNYSARIVRHAGVNGAFEIVTHGSNGIELNTLDGSAVSHNGDNVLTTTAGKAVDSDKLNGQSASYYQRNLENVATIELNRWISGDASSFIDFHASSSQSDHSFRLIRNSGANGTVEFKQVGTGGFRFTGGSEVRSYVPLRCETLEVDKSHQLSSGTNLNNMTLGGFFDVNNPTGTLPGGFSGWGYLEVFVHSNASTHIFQRLTGFDNAIPSTWQRVKEVTWGPWRALSLAS